MDRYALQSHMRAVLAGKDGIFAREIIPVPLASGITMTDDDGPRADTTLEKLATLRPVFRKGGRVTAGNSCPLNDGAAAAVVMSRARADAARDRAARAHHLDRRQRPGARADGPGPDRVQPAGAGPGRADHR